MKHTLLDYLVISYSGLFDVHYYLREYPDVRRADVNPLKHFLISGWKENRNPSQSFDIQRYLAANPDVRAANINPVIHYIRFGKKEHRSIFATDGRELSVPGKALKDESIGAYRLFSVTNLKKSLRYIRRYGLAAFKRKAANEFLSLKAEANFVKVDEPITVYRQQGTMAVGDLVDTQSGFSSAVSIVIPTKNAGVDFEYLLKVLKNQKGFEKIEIIIVDSGSTDNTLSIAREFGAKIVKIPAKQFSHSGSRNLGAENASGDYLLFTVQDALPPNETWLYELMTVLTANEVIAVSCAEYPREDADLFYRLISWNHYNFLGVSENDRILKLPPNPNYLTLRQNGQLSDLACLISRATFMKYRYRRDYAEDLDLGIRLIKDGFKIAFLTSTRIIHSHNRPASYFLKRGYVDNLFLADMFDDYPIAQLSFSDLFPDIIFFYDYLNREIDEKLAVTASFDTLSSIQSAVQGIFDSAKSQVCQSKIELKNYGYVDEDYLALLRNILSYSADLKEGEKYKGVLMDALSGYSNIMFRYLETSYEEFDEHILEEIKVCLNKALSQTIGAILSNCYVKSSESEKKYFNSLHLLLKEGI